MTTIVTRAGKGSPLTNNEMDSNLTNLNTYKVETNNPSTTGTLTHSGNIVLSGSGVIQDANGYELGYKDVPSNNQTASYTLARTDRGKSIDFTGGSGQTITIPANASVAFPVGTTITITNLSANGLSLAITSNTLRMAGTSNVGTRTIAAYGMATVRKVNSTTWMVSGAGVS